MSVVLRMVSRAALTLLIVGVTAGLASAQAAGPIGGSINQATIATRWPAIAYDTQNHVYLTVFGSGGVIKGAFIGDDGIRIGNIFDITTGNYAQTPRVAFNTQDGNFLVVWHSSDTPLGTVVRARAVSYPSVSPGPGTAISSASYSTVWENGPAVAYGAGSNRFIIAWSYYSGPSWEVAARIVDAAGTPVLAEIPLSSGVEDTEQEPAAGYFPDQDRFIVAWGAYNEAGKFAIGRTRLFDAATGAAATTQIQFTQGTQVRVADMAWNNATEQMFLTWIQPDPASGGAFRPYGYYINSSGVFGSATGTKLSSTVGAYDANSVAYNQRTTTFFYVTHGSTEQDFGFEISSAGLPLDTAKSVTTVGGTPTLTGSFNPRLAASTQEPRWLIGTAGSFTSLWTQLIGGTAVLPPPGGTTTYRLTISPTPTGGTVTADGLQCGTGGATCSVTLQAAATLTLTATPDTNYSFSSWGGSCSGTSATTNVSVDAIKTCSATFTYTGGGGGPGPTGCSAIPTPVFPASPGPIGPSVNRGTLATRWPSIAYDECRQVYLAVFGSAGTIMGQFIDDAGTAVGGLFAISSGNYAQTPRVAYNSSTGNFLVVWHSTESTVPNRAGVRGIVVTYPGGTPGPGTIISSASYSTVWENAPAVAYGAGSDRYVIAWAYYSTGSWEVAARIVDGTGTPVFSEIALSSGTANTEQEPSVGYFPDTNRFMVAWGAYDEVGGFARGRTQLFDAASGNAATTQIQFAQGTQVRVSDMALNSATSQMFLTWIQPDPASGGAFRPFGYYMSSSGVFGSASGARLSSTVGAYDANSLAYNPLSATFFLVTHGSTEQDWGFEVAGDGTAMRSAAAVTTVSGTPAMTGSFNPRLAASTRQPRWLIGVAGSFTSFWTQLIGGTQPPVLSYSLTISPTPSNGTVTGGGLTCGTGGVTCTQVYGSPTTVTLTASPATGFALVSWGGACSGSAATASVLVNGDKTCSATFSPLTVTPSALRFGATKDGAAGKITSVTAAQTVTVTMLGAPVAWTVTVDQPWLQLTNPAGTGDGQFIVDVINPNNVLGASTNVTAVLTVTPATAGSAATTIPVNLTIDLTGTATTPPFGQVDTPVQNATGLMGAVGVTGWALDDVGVRGVKIYRNCLPFDTPASCSTVGTSRVVFIGDAAFLEGARPDVEAAFPTYPQPYRAGWGYLLLSNMLPHVPGAQAYGGQGTLTLYAFAFDAEGKTTLLGRSRVDSVPTTITVANDSIAKPFGALDTPAQGETVSGLLANFGWALTPDTDTTAGADDIVIPTNGSTTILFIDGVAVSPVAYNQCRGTVGNPVSPGLYCNDDVANIFGSTPPQPSLTLRTSNPTKYRNLDIERAAIGAYGIDTTTLANGLHTIAWGVTDSAGRQEGIGSRFFTVFNGSVATSSERSIATTAVSAQASIAALRAAPAQSRGDARTVEWLARAAGTVWGRTGFDLSAPIDEVPANEAGVRQVQLNELGRLELWLGRVDGGYLVANGTLRDLPPGSQLDTASGRFTWMPGPGYVGTYRLLFVRDARQIPIDVTVRPTRAAGPGESEIQMYLDTPFTGQVVGQAFTVAGWALDPQAAIGTGIAEVHVWARRLDRPAAPAVFLGAATLGGARPDVAAVYGTQFGRAGFGLTAPALDSGYYEITAFVFNRRTDRWEDARTARVTVR